MGNELTTGIHQDLTGMPLFPLAGVNWRGHSIPLGTHTNPGFEITHLLSGRVCWRVEGGPSLPLSGGDMAITQPDVPHRGELEVIEPGRLFWFVVAPTVVGATAFTPFSQDELNTIEHLLRIAGNQVARANKELDGVHTQMAELLSNWEPPLLSNSTFRIPRIRSLLTSGLLAAISSLEASPDGHGPHAMVNSACQWMERHFESPDASVAKLGEALGYCATHIRIVFKKHMGLTPSDYLQRLRIDKALILLTTTKLPVGDIALRLGFPSSQYFSDRFCRFTGLSPRRYREKNGASLNRNDV